VVLLLYKILSVPTNNVANLWLHYAMNIEYVKKTKANFWFTLCNKHFVCK
jgi:hypothetical protein